MATQYFPVRGVASVALVICSVLSALWAFTEQVQASGGDLPIVDGVPTQFGTLQHHGDPLAVHLGVGDDPSECKHYQGLVRWDAADGTPVFLISRSGNPTITCQSEGYEPAELLIVPMGSRDKDGERLRSNRLQRSRSMEDTVPPMDDRGMARIAFDGISLDGNGALWPKYFHAGGMQVIDDVLVIPFECTCDTNMSPPALLTCVQQIGGCAGTAGIVLIDLANFDANNPDPQDLILLFHQSLPLSGLGVVAVAKNPSTDKYLFVFTSGDSSQLTFYESNTDDLRTTTSLTPLPFSWNKSFLRSQDQDKWRSWQTINFVRGSDGKYFLIGTENAGALSTPFGDDMAGLFQFSFGFLTPSGIDDAISYVAERHLKLNDPTMGNLDAGAGVYVSPSSQLILYTIDHDNEGPKSYVDGKNVVELGEFRNYNVTAPPTVNATLCSGWVELYHDETGWSDDSPNRSLMYDVRDRGLENWENLSLHDDFANKASSVRWHLPTGRRVRLYSGTHFFGSSYDLVGNGDLRRITDLSSEGFGDDIESVEFRPYAYAGSGKYQGYAGQPVLLNKANPCYTSYQEPGIVFQWSSSEASCQFSNANAAQPTVTCANPGKHTVQVEVFYLNVSQGSNSAELEILSVPLNVPVVTAGPDRSVDEGEAAQIEVTLSNMPSNVFLKIVMFYLGDGRQIPLFVIGPSALPPYHTNAQLTLPYPYADDGDYPVTICLESGQTPICDTLNVEVANVEPVLQGFTPLTVMEGETVELNGEVVEPGASDVLTLTVKWGDDVEEALPWGTGSQVVNPTHLYADDSGDGSYAVNLLIVEDDGGSSNTQTNVTVKNAAPVIAEVSGPTVLESSPTVTLTVVATDAAGIEDPLLYAFDCDDDGVYEIGAQSANSAACSFGNSGSHEVNVRVTDDDDGETVTTTLALVENVSPTVQLLVAESVGSHDEPFALSGTWSDPMGSADAPYDWTLDFDGDGIADDNGSAQSDDVEISRAVTFEVAGTYTPTLAVTDKDGGQGSSSVQIVVQNSPPLCDKARAEPQILWPPDRRMVSISILGVTDPDDDPISLLITEITQDEEVGHTRYTPDATGVGTDTAQVRAQRASSGDGRVYHISFTANDGHGGGCQGVVLVGVPRRVTGDTDIGDDGELYDATTPSTEPGPADLPTEDDDLEMDDPADDDTLDAIRIVDAPDSGETEIFLPSAGR